MSTHTRNSLVFGAAALLAAIVCGGAGAHAETLTLTATYTTPTSLKVTYDGSTVSNSTVIPAGSYTVEVNDDPNNGDQNPNFTISGPGVSYSGNLDSTGMGIDGLSELGPFTFQTSSTYSIEDKNLGSSSLTTFMTSSTVQSGGTTTTTSSGPSPTPTPTPTPKPATVLGTLSTTVSSSGKLKLSFGGKAVKTLEPGRYTVHVLDGAKKHGLVLDHGATHATLSGVAAVGSSSHKVTLAKGRYTLVVSGGGAKISFSVS